MLKKFCTDESGQGMVEYVLIIAFIALAVVGLLTTFGTALNQQYDEIDKLVNVTP